MNRLRQLRFVALLPFLTGHGPVVHPLQSDASVFVANVADASTGAPVVGAEVAIADLSRVARTDWIGEAQMTDVSRGRHRVTVRRIGFVPANLTIEFSRDTVGYVFVLSPAPLSLDTVRTSATFAAWPQFEDFERRRRMGFGRFLTDSVLMAEKTQPLADIMERRLAGLQSFDVGRTVRRRTCGGQPLDIYVDGVRVGGITSRPLGARPLPSLTDLRFTQGQDVAGVEYYDLASAPPQYRRPETKCGVVLIWLRP
jgi:hypothetical protein